MKKIILTLFAAVLALGLVACKSAPQSNDLSDSFGKVYANYTDVLNLEGAETYEVKKGDTLTAITKSFYGEDNGYYFPLIMLASREVVQDPEFIEPGMQLTIPSLEANIGDAETAKKLSPYFKDIAGVYEKKTTKAAPDIREHLTEISTDLGNK